MAAIIRWTLRTLLALAALALLLVTLVYLLLNTQRGTQWLLNKTLPQVSPQARFVSVTGTLSKGVTLVGLEVPMAAADIRIGRAEGQWSLLDLLGGQFPIQRLSLSDVAVVLHSAEQEPISEPGPWPSLALPFPVALTSGEVTNLTITLGETTHHIDHIALQISGGLLHTRIGNLTIVMRDEQGEQHLSLSGQIGNSAPYPFNLTVDWGATLPDTTPLAGRGTLAGTLAAIRLDHNLLQPSPVSTRGDVKLGFELHRASIDPASIQLSIDNQWTKLRVPVTLKPGMESDGTLHLAGGWNDYRFELQSRLTALLEGAADSDPVVEPNPALEQILATTLTEPGQIFIKGSGQQLQVELHQLLVEMAAGSINASGQLDAGQPLGWDLRLSLSDLQAGLLAPEWPAVISGEVETRGHWQAENYEISLVIERLAGQIFDQTIVGNGNITLSNDQQTIDNLLLRLGDNQLSIHGKISDTLALDWQLEAPTLSQLYPAMAGAMASTGSLQGTLQKPLVRAQLSGKDLKYADASIDALNFSLHTDEQGNHALDLNARGIDALPLQDGDVTLKGQGNLQQHQLTAALEDKDNKLSLALVGGLAGNIWAGKLTALVLENPLIGPWQLASATPLQAAPGAVNLEPLCLTQQQSQLCARFRLEEDNITLEGNIDDLQLARFTDALPEEAAISGAINSRFAFHGPANNLQGNLALFVDPLQLMYQPVETEEVVKHNATLTATAALDKTGLSAELDFAIDQVGTLRALISSSAAAGANPLQRPMEGTVRGHFDNLVWLGDLFPQLDNLEGTLDVDLAISGTPVAPQVVGNLHLDQLAMEIPLAGIALQQGHVTLALDRIGGWRLNGGLASGSGVLTVEGEGLLRDTSGPSGQLSIRGERFTLVDLPDTMVLVSPDIQISLDPKAIAIRGDINIPDGRFILKSLPEQAVEVSADERIYPSEEKAASPGRPLNTRVQITLNDSFRFEGFGLATRLGGSLRLSQRGTAPPQAVGTLSLYDGVYQAYGQHLNVERGLLIFQGPVDNPGLNITAVRKTPQATVGIVIGGVAQDIRSEIFSNPSLPPTEVMALLITGKAPSDMTESDANQVVNAAASLGISQSEWITSRLQSTFGLDVLNLQGGDEYMDSSLIVGKYLTPDLFVSYVQNLFTPAGSVQLEYSLTRSLGLKARSGDTQSIDLLYKIEH